MKRLSTLVITLLILMMIFTSCQAIPTAPTAAATPVEDMKLKIGILPAVDSAPILLAEKKGFVE